MQKKFFTIDEVNELIPQLEHHFRLLLQHKKEMAKAALRLRKLGFEPSLLENERLPQASPEAERLHAKLQEHYQTFKQNLLAIERTGGEIKDLELGRVEFPSLENGAEIGLTWQLGVTEAAHRNGEEDTPFPFFEIPKIRRVG